MAIGTVTKYNQWEDITGGAANRQWDDATAGNIMFVLAKASYTPSAAHTTVANIGIADVDYIATGDGAPIAATTLDVDATTTPGTTYYDSDAANFGANVTISAKYLIAVQPVTAGTFASTAKLLWYVDLDTTSTSSEVSSTASTFSVDASVNGWLSST